MELVDLGTSILGKTSDSLRLLLYAVLALLAIGCVNVAGLLLARGVKREREVALRAAVGAARGRIVRQVLTEALAVRRVRGGGGRDAGLWAAAGDSHAADFCTGARR